MRSCEPIFAGGTARPNAVFKRLVTFAGIQEKINVETGIVKEWSLVDLRKTYATYYHEQMSESSIEVLAHSVDGVTYRHYAHREPLALKAITTISQPSAFMALPHGIEEECPCCQWKFAGE
ncbi:site-specific integrase [Rhodopirellula baltica]